MLPLQLWIHLSKSLEISHEEDRDKRESTQSVYFLLARAWRCRALMWVFISIQIDPVIIFSQDFLLQLLRLRTWNFQMVSNEAYYKGEKLYNLTGYVWTSIASKSMFNNSEFRRFLTEIRVWM